jgi:putative NADPH-quinone reductase
MLKMIEKALHQEISSLYSLVRDLLFTIAYVQLNAPMIGRELYDIAYEQESIDKLEAWLLQLASVKEIVREQFDTP